MIEESSPSEAVGSFSAAARREQWCALGGRTFDLLVIGGGITGVGTAHEAAGRGLDVALVEAGDFAQGTSSRSSRLIHGGLRYLETFDFGLVFEALGERRRLLELAPHLVHPLGFLYPVYRGAEVGIMKLTAGMWLYDLLALFGGVASHRMLGRSAVLEREPHLQRNGLRGGAVYHDAQVDDARLTLAVARAAHEAGALLVPRAEVVATLRGADGRVGGVVVRDALTGEEQEVRARLVLSATGPWTDELRHLADPSAPPRLRPTKGVHLELPAERVGNRGAIIFRSAVDGRVMFVLPWGDFTYVGTTDTDFRGPASAAHAEPADVDYLLRSTNALFPDAHLRPEEVRSTWAGVRPLLAPDAALSASQTSREHEIWRDESGLLCIAGGKLTTFRVMAAEAAEEAARILRTEHGVAAGVFHSEHLPLPGAPREGWEPFRDRLLREAAALGLSEGSATHLGRAYGTDARDLLRRIRDEPALGEPIIPGLSYLWAEIGHAVRCEMALTLEDVLRRRTHLFYDAQDGGVSVAREVAAAMGGEPGLGWSGEEMEREVEEYAKAVGRTRAALSG